MALNWSDDEDWPEEILEVARDFFNCTIDVILPGKPGKYDPITDTNTGEGYVAPTTILEARAARAQHIRLPLEQAGAYEWSTKRRYRFQIELLAADPVVRKGMVVRVRAGGRDPVLENFAFEVASASNSSHAALRTIETLTEFGVSPA
jgi:hypothetical protein